MDLYRFIVKTTLETVDVIIAAQSEEDAFILVEKELEMDYIKMPLIEYIGLYEKKKIKSGSGFVIKRDSNSFM